VDPFIVISSSVKLGRIISYGIEFQDLMLNIPKSSAVSILLCKVGGIEFIRLSLLYRPRNALSGINLYIIFCVNPSTSQTSKETSEG
jgi:hypothetical protein